MVRGSLGARAWAHERRAWPARFDECGLDERFQSLSVSHSRRTPSKAPQSGVERANRPISTGPLYQYAFLPPTLQSPAAHVFELVELIEERIHARCGWSSRGKDRGDLIGLRAHLRPDGPAPSRAHAGHSGPAKSMQSPHITGWLSFFRCLQSACSRMGSTGTVDLTESHARPSAITFAGENRVSIAEALGQ